MVEIEIADGTSTTKVFFPETWEELSEEQLLRIVPFLAKDEPTPEDKYLAFRILTPSVKPEVWVSLDDDQLLALLPFTDFLFRPIPLRTTRIFRMGLRWYYLPAPEDLKLADYVVAADQIFRLYASNPTEQVLNLLVASICRPRKWWVVLFPWLLQLNTAWNGDLREKYHSGIAERRAKKLGRIPIYKRLAVVTWVLELRRQTYRSNKALHVSNSPKKKGQASGDWVDVAMSVASEGLFGNFEATMQQPLSTILRYLHHRKNSAA